MREKHVNMKTEAKKKKSNEKNEVRNINGKQIPLLGLGNITDFYIMKHFF